MPGSGPSLPIRGFRAARRAPLSGLALLGCCLATLLPCELRSQDDEISDQLWFDFIIGKTHGERLYLELETEPKVQVSGGDPWRNIDLTPLVEYYPNAWIDLTAEATVGNTHQEPDINTFEVTPRLGIRYHFLKQSLGRLKSASPEEKPIAGLTRGALDRISLSRFDFAMYVRVEYRNFWYSDDTESQHSTRLRGRLEYKVALNRDSLQAVGVMYLLGDVEYYSPLEEDIEERFAAKTRLRIGLGYRLNPNHRLEAILVRDWTRDTPEGEETLGARAIQVRWRVNY